MQDARKVKTVTRLGLALVALASLAGACGDDDEETTRSPADGGGVDVSVQEGTPVGTVLVDREGMTLYTPDQEADGTIRCTGDCADIWPPLTVGSGTPSAADSLSGAVSTVARPDGSQQVTYEGKPLYRLSLDSAPGSVGGEGVVDAFAGTEFVWHAVATEAPSGQTPTPTTSAIDYGY